MTRKNTVDALEMISKFRNRILDRKPSMTKMYQDVRMMRFKIRPLQGDISFINLKDKNFIEILWSLGKLDEFFHGHIEKVSPAEQETFYKVIDEMYDKFQEQLNTLDLKYERFPQTASTFEMEIYKETEKHPN